MPSFVKQFSKVIIYILSVSCVFEEWTSRVGNGVRWHISGKSPEISSFEWSKRLSRQLRYKGEIPR